MGKRWGWLECALGANCDHVLTLNYQSMVERPIKRGGGTKVVERPARVDGKGRRFAQISEMRQNVIVLR